MITLCKGLRSFFVRHETAANAVALLGVTMLLASVYVASGYYADILAWVSANPLPHVLVLGAVTLVGSVLILSLICLGFSEHTHEHRTCAHSFRGRGRSRALLPALHAWVGHMGMNPRWREARQPQR
ncbi:MAG: hypothetical protein ABT940_06460 [Alphaproteobacteria bacterium]